MIIAQPMSSLVAHLTTCGRSNSGSYPDILQNIVHKVKTQDGERTLLNPGNKKSF